MMCIKDLSKALALPVLVSFFGTASAAGAVNGQQCELSGTGGFNRCDVVLNKQDIIQVRCSHCSQPGGGTKKTYNHQLACSFISGTGNVVFLPPNAEHNPKPSFVPNRTYDFSPDKTLGIQMETHQDGGLMLELIVVSIKTAPVTFNCTDSNKQD